MNKVELKKERFHLSRYLSCSFTDAITRITTELQKEGFGIITTIDLKEAFKNKLHKDFRDYKILGACNPGLAYQALQADDKIGVYLPCNVVVQQHGIDQVEVSIINPEEIIHGTTDSSLRKFATGVKQAMERVLERL